METLTYLVFNKTHYRYWNSSFKIIIKEDFIEDYTYFHIIKENDNFNVSIIRKKQPNEIFIKINYLFTYNDLTAKTTIDQDILKEEDINLEIFNSTTITFKKWITICKATYQKQEIISTGIRLTKRLLETLTLDESLNDDTIYFSINKLGSIVIGYALGLYKEPSAKDDTNAMFDCIEFGIGYFDKDKNFIKKRDPKMSRVLKTQMNIQDTIDEISNYAGKTLFEIDFHRIYLKKPEKQYIRLTESYLYYRLSEYHIINKQYDYPFHFFGIYYTKKENRYYLIQINRFDFENLYGTAILYFDGINIVDQNKNYVFNDKDYEFKSFYSLDESVKNTIYDALIEKEFNVVYIPNIEITSKSIRNYQQLSIINRIESKRPECFFWIQLRNANYHLYFVEITKKSDDIYQTNIRKIGLLEISKENKITFVGGYENDITLDKNKDDLKMFNENNEINQLLEKKDDIYFEYLFPTKDIILGKFVLIDSSKSSSKPLVKIDYSPPFSKTVIERHRGILYHPEIGRREAEIRFSNGNKFIFHKILFVNEQEIDGTKYWIIDYENKNNDIRYYDGMPHKFGNEEYYTFDRRENNKFNRTEWTNFDISLIILKNRQIIRYFESDIQLGDGILIEKAKEEKDINMTATIDITENVWSIKKIILKDSPIEIKEGLTTFF